MHYANSEISFPLPQIILNDWMKTGDVKKEKIKMYFNPNYRSQEKENYIYRFTDQSVTRWSNLHFFWKLNTQKL